MAEPLVGGCSKDDCGGPRCPSTSREACIVLWRKFVIHQRLRATLEHQKLSEDVMENLDAVKCINGDTSGSTESSQKFLRYDHIKQLIKSLEQENNLEQTWGTSGSRSQRCRFLMS